MLLQYEGCQRLFDLCSPTLLDLTPDRSRCLVSTIPLHGRRWSSVEINFFFCCQLHFCHEDRGADKRKSNAYIVFPHCRPLFLTLQLHARFIIVMAATQDWSSAAWPLADAALEAELLDLVQACQRMFCPSPANCSEADIFPRRCPTAQARSQRIYEGLEPRHLGTAHPSQRHRAACDPASPASSLRG